jgi:hypothetical protein
MKNADMPVSPCEYFHTNQDAPAGLTKREYFAGLAMQAIASSPEVSACDGVYVATRAVEWADSLLAELEESDD